MVRVSGELAEPGTEVAEKEAEGAALLVMAFW